MDHGSVFRCCGCRDQETGRLLGGAVPEAGLGAARVVVLQRRPALGDRGPAAGALRRVYDQGGGAGGAIRPGTGRARGLTTGELLGRWLVSRVSLRASTSCGYAAHVRGYLVPYLGGIPLAELSPADVQAMFAAIIRGEAALGRPVSAATLSRIHATLRAALNAAVRAGLITSNPGRWPELPAAARPRPQVWTPALTGRGRREGWRPVVGVDRRADRRVLGPGAGSPAACAVPPGRAARAALR